MAASPRSDRRLAAVLCFCDGTSSRRHNLPRLGRSARLSAGPGAADLQGRRRGRLPGQRKVLPEQNGGFFQARAPPPCRQLKQTRSTMREPSGLHAIPDGSLDTAGTPARGPVLSCRIRTYRIQLSARPDDGRCSNTGDDIVQGPPQAFGSREEGEAGTACSAM